MLILSELLRRRDTYYAIVIVSLAVFGWQTRAAYKADEAIIATRPKVETRIETRTVTGPERIVEKLVKGEVVERVIDKGPTTTDRDFDRAVVPACLPVVKQPWRYAGVLVDPSEKTKLVGLRGGVTLWNRFDLGLAGRLAPRREGQLELSVRF